MSESEKMDAGNFTVAPSPELEPWAEKALADQTPEQSAQQQQQDPVASEVLYFQIPQLGFSDERGLADILMKHPDLHEQILATAAGFMSNYTIVEALEIVRAENERTKPAAEPKQETTAPAVVEQQAEAEKAEAPDQAVAEPGWVVRARAFNAGHEDQVNLFNIATGFAAQDHHGVPDPNAIARWQVENGLEPDGRIGQETADVAWKLMPVEAPQQAAPANDELPPPL